MTTLEPRSLNQAELDLLKRLLTEGRFPGAPDLVDQLDGASIRGGLPTLLDLQVANGAARAPISDGPVPLRALVVNPDGEVEGEIIIWVKDGYLSGLEHAWYTDDTPTEMPSVDRIRIE